MANDYMAKLAADLEGMSMMREPKPMPIIYRDMGGDLDMGGFDFADAADIGAAETGSYAGGDDDGSSEDYTEAELQEAKFDTPADLFVDPTPQATQDIADVANQFGLTIEEAAELLGPTGVGRGGPGEFEGFGVGRSGDTISALNRTFNKEGIPKEFVPYYNSLKDRGLSNEQAMATLAAVAGTPGGAGALSSGYTDGYSYGGPMGTLEDLIETGQTASLEQRAKKAKEKQEKQDKELEDFVGEPDIKQEPGLGDRFASILSNPFSTTVSPKDQAVLDSYSAQGLEVKGPSMLGNLAGVAGGFTLPVGVNFAMNALGKLTGTDIIGTAIDPVTGFEYLVESGGGLQLAADQLGDAPNQDAGNEPTITKKRKVATEKPKEEEKKEKEEEKDYFPEQKLPRLSQSGLETLQYAYRNDPPEVLDNILNKYTLPDQTSGLKALV